MSSTLRVGLIAYALDRAPTGIGRYSIEIIKALASLENTPEITILSAGGIGKLADLGLPQFVLKGTRLLPGLVTLGNVEIARAARQLKLDIIHDPTGVTPFLLQMKPTKTIGTIHDVFPLSFPGVSTRLDTLIYRYWLPKVLPRVDVVVTVSNASKNDILRHLRVKDERIRVIREGVDQNFRPSTKAEQQQALARYGLTPGYLLFVGSIEERKNLSRVLAAYAQLRHKGISRKLVIVGPAKWKYGPIMETLDTLKLNDDVIFTGYVDFQELPALYSAADVFVFPSLYEGFGLPVLEAMACGTPVITANVSSLPEVAGDAALLVDPYDVDALAQAMYRILTEEALRQTLREKGLNRVKQFTWEQTAREILQVYEQVSAS